MYTYVTRSIKINLISAQINYTFISIFSSEFQDCQYTHVRYVANFCLVRYTLKQDIAE